jgi:UDP-N-acetylmuramoylalanine--D-glutamate ligase
MTIDELKQKKVLILGLGVNNRKLVEFLDEHGVKHDTVSEWKDSRELTEKISSYEVVFRTPGLPFRSPAIVEAIKKGITIYSQTKLFFDLCPAPIVGVTGTKGKGTVSTLIARIFEKAGKKVWLGGNIGLDPFEFLDQITPSDTVVLELSSFQLQDMHKSPHLAVVTNISIDHLDHHASLEEYMEAKANILRFQKKTDLAVLNKVLPESFSKIGSARKVFFTASDANRYPSRLPGGHNLENIAAAAKACEALGISHEDISAAVSEFENLPHHLQIVGEKDGITFVNDSASTNPDSTLAAIKSFDKDMVLIMGGSDKGLNYDHLLSEIMNSKKIKAVVVMGQLTDQITANLKGYKGKIVPGSQNISEILQQAFSEAGKDSLILFSPGAASFDMFANAKDRGEQFTKAVNEI